MSDHESAQDTLRRGADTLLQRVQKRLTLPSKPKMSGTKLATPAQRYSPLLTERVRDLKSAVKSPKNSSR